MLPSNALSSRLDGLIDRTANDTNGAQRKPTTKKRPSTSRESKGNDEQIIPIVEKDGLFVTFCHDPAFEAPTATKRSRSRQDKVLQTFCRVFREVWQCIPAVDRRLMIGHWHDRKWWHMWHGRTPVPRYLPVIRIEYANEALTWRETLRRGILTFPYWLIRDKQKDLAVGLARVLAQVFCEATGEHYGLILELIEEPLERWEKETAVVSEEARNKKLDEFEKDYLLRFYVKIAQIMERWDVKPDEAGQLLKEEREQVDHNCRR